VRNGLLTCQRVKLFSDGSLGAETAALRTPYVGTDNRGVLIHPLDELTEKVRTAHQQGYQLEVHAIGDRALETVLDAFEGAGLQPSDRPIITHCQVHLKKQYLGVNEILVADMHGILSLGAGHG